MNVIAFIKNLFTVMGLCMLGGALLLYQQTDAFVSKAIKTEGTVVNLVRSTSGSGMNYIPVVHFSGRNGESIIFISSTGSNPPGYAKGEKVEVLYLPTEPQHATINALFPIWGGSIILGSMGGVFFLIGGAMILIPLLNGQREKALKEEGYSIESEFKGIELNRSISVNGRSPWRIITEWRNPSTAKVYRFKSHDLWFDPSEYIKNKTVRVFIDRNNPKKYTLDLSFLPKHPE